MKSNRSTSWARSSEPDSRRVLSSLRYRERQCAIAVDAGKSEDEGEFHVDDKEARMKKALGEVQKSEKYQVNYSFLSVYLKGNIGSPT
jgi:hypothetical protein